MYNNLSNGFLSQGTFVSMPSSMHIQRAWHLSFTAVRKKECHSRCTYKLRCVPLLLLLAAVHPLVNSTLD